MEAITIQNSVTKVLRPVRGRGRDEARVAALPSGDFSGDFFGIHQPQPPQPAPGSPFSRSGYLSPPDGMEWS